MFTGIYQSATILAVIVVLYVVDFWLIHRYDPFRTKGSTRNWNYTIKAVIAAAFVIAQPTVWPRLGVYTEAWWGLLVQGVGLALVCIALSLHWWARVHLRQFYSERVEFQAGQHLVETGPYALVRHPIYTSWFALGSGLFLVNPALPTLLAMIYVFLDFSQAARRDEAVLVENLPGYAEYMARTPRFFPKLRS